MVEPKKQIMSSRGFGTPVYVLDELREAVAFHTATAAERLRQQGSVAKGLYVFVVGRRAKGEPLESAGETLTVNGGSRRNNGILAIDHKPCPQTAAFM